MAITALGQGNSNGVAATAQDAAAWRQKHGPTHLVTADGGFQGMAPYVASNGSISIPAHVLLAPGMEIHSKQTGGEINKIPEVLPD